MQHIEVTMAQAIWKMIIVRVLVMFTVSTEFGMHGSECVATDTVGCLQSKSHHQKGYPKSIHERKT